MSDRITVSFPGTDFPAVEVPGACELSEHLTAKNSPILFGCRTGICGTCACLVEAEVPPPDEEELEVLEAVAEGVEGARLACQLRLEVDAALRKIPEDA